MSLTDSRFGFAVAAALLAGALMTLSFAPFGWYPLAVLCPALLFRLWYGANARRAFVIGWLFGLGHFGTGISWVYASISVYGNMAAPLAILATMLFVAIFALYPAFLGLLLAKLPRRGLLNSFIFSYPAAWILFEWIRSWLFGGFPWLQPGYSQIDSPLAGFAPIGGVYLVSLAVMFSAGLVALASEHKKYRLQVVLGIAALWLCGSALQGLDWTKTSGEKIQVALLQGNIPQLMHWDSDYLQNTLQIYSDMTRESAGVDLIVWPENALPLFQDRLPEGFLAQLLGLAQGADLLIGMPVREENGNYYNAIVNPRGGDYRKSHLVPFGEFIPFKTLLGGLLDILQVPMSDFSPGPADQPAMQLQKAKIGLSICFEDVFGEEMINALPEAELLLNLSNDSWFGATVAPNQHLEIARMRALEAGRYLLRATNTGISAAIDHRGKVHTQSELFEKRALQVSAELRQGATPYSRIGNLWMLLLGLLLIVGGVGGKYWREKV